MSDQQNWQNQAWQQTTQTQHPEQQAYNAPTGQMPPQPMQYAYPAAQSVQAPPQKSKGWIVGLAIVGALFLLLAIGMFSCTSMISSSMNSTFGNSYDESVFTSGNTVAVIDINGTIQYDGSTCSPEGLKQQLDKAEENSDIKAVVLRVDSGGGVATAGEEMSNYVKDFSKPIVVSTASLNASAAYEISSQTDYIFAAKTSSVGAIGTAMSVMDLSGLYGMLGINVENITSSESKDSSYGDRPLTEEERAYYQDIVNQINGTFLEVVAEGRDMSIEEVRALATGLPFTGMTGVENGLVDEIGTFEDACDKAASLAGISSYDTINLYTYSSLSVLDMMDLLSSFSNDQELNDLVKGLESNGAFTN